MRPWGDVHVHYRISRQRQDPTAAEWCATIEGRWFGYADTPWEAISKATVSFMRLESPRAKP